MNVRRGVVIGSAILALVGLMSSPRLLFGSDQSQSPRRKSFSRPACNATGWRVSRIRASI